MYKYEITFETEEDATEGLNALEDAQEKGFIENPFEVKAVDDE